jgi:hypothetical protein
MPGVETSRATHIDPEVPRSGPTAPSTGSTVLRSLNRQSSAATAALYNAV